MGSITVATELHLSADTVEPSPADLRIAPAARIAHAPTLSWSERYARLECCAVGRTVLGTLRWAVVCGLVLAGYFGAGAINAGVEHAMQGGPSVNGVQPILAASSPGK